jgi:hypothetical protein
VRIWRVDHAFLVVNLRIPFRRLINVNIIYTSNLI